MPHWHILFMYRFATYIIQDHFADIIFLSGIHIVIPDQIETTTKIFL
ncbi:hypothetical protein Q427_01500 [Halomonas sp. BC04]|nr:hypothetical protein Q427_01500 [Halomonas sp. BC04]